MFPEQAEAQNPPVLKGKALAKALDLAVHNSPLRPDEVAGFLAQDAEGERIPHLDKWAPWTFMIAHLATLGNLNYKGEKLPTLGEVPLIIHAYSQAIHNLSVNSANAPTIRDHMPYMFLAGFLGWGAFRTLPRMANVVSRRSKVADAQKVMKGRIDNGEQAFVMKANHTAAFVGNGDHTGDLLQESHPANEVMCYGNATLPSEVWQKMSIGGNQREAFKAFDRGDLAKAGEIVLFPVKDEEMFLPGPDDHDMHIDEMRALVETVDKYCAEKGVDQKRVIIVGRRSMSETYRTTNADGTCEESSETLGELVINLNMARVGEVSIFDPTEVVMELIAQKAAGRRIQFSATSKGVDRYGKRFFDALRDTGYQTTEAQTVRVFYDITDIPTLVRTRQDDIAIVLDARKKAVLLEKGMPGDNIIVVPEVVVANLCQEVAEQ